MLYYPQLATGLIAQYPVRRRNARRTIVNQLADGSAIYTGDDGGAQVRWELEYAHLTTAESDDLSGLFGATQGAWQTFTFLDPTDNLLSWSEDLTQPAWKADALLTLAGGVADPLGGHAAMRLTNGAQIQQHIKQSLSVPGWYQYCLSAYLRADQMATADLIVSNGAEDSADTFTITPYWTRVQVSFAMQSKTDAVTVGIRLPAGATVFAFGLQLEPQPGAGGYKKTRNRAGVYPSSRFDQDTLRTIATGHDQNYCKVIIISPVAG